MNYMNMVCFWIAEVVPLAATLFCLIYGLIHFFRKGKPLFLQSLALAMACYALSEIYHLCLTYTSEVVMEGFTPAYLGRIGFYMFFMTGSYGQLDRIVDDRTAKMRPARWIALLAPVCAVLLYLPNGLLHDIPLSTKISYALVWLPAIISVYYNLKHALIPDLDFGFIKALKPYNVLAVFLGIAELVCMTAWNYDNDIFLAAISVIVAVLCVCTTIAAKKGAEKWTI